MTCLADTRQPNSVEVGIAFFLPVSDFFEVFSENFSVSGAFTPLVARESTRTRAVFYSISRQALLHLERVARNQQASCRIDPRQIREHCSRLENVLLSTV